MNITIPLLTTLCGLSLNTNNPNNNVYEEPLAEEIINEDKEFQIKENNIISSSYVMDEDVFEPNDNISDASKICPDDFYLKESYKVDIEATLDYMEMIQDIDYYYLTIFSDSNVTIDIAASSNYDGYFQFALINYDYYTIENGYAYHSTNDIFSNYDGTRRVHYSNSLRPGTYLIYLRGCQNNNFTDTLPYTIEVNVSKVVRPDADIPKNDLLMQDDILGAVWISDFLPCDNAKLFDLTSQYTYYKPSQTNLQYPDFALDTLREVSNGEPINVANFYIWDNALRHTLHELFVETKNLFIDQIDGKYNSNVKLKIQQNSLTKGLEIVASVLGNDLIPKQISIPANIISQIGFSVIEAYYSSLINEITPNDVKFGIYLGMLTQAFYVSVPDGIEHTHENVIEYGIKEVTFVPIYYNLGVKTSTIPNQNEHYYSFKSSSEAAARIDSLIYAEDYFLANQPGNKYSNGKIYKIKNYDDLFDCADLELAKPHEHIYDGHYCIYCNAYQPNHTYDGHYCIYCNAYRPTHIYDGHYCIYCNAYTSTHDYDRNYIWVDKTKHKATCRCGATTTQPHVVSSGSQKCLLCGGAADMGFITPNSKIMNILLMNDYKSFILPNGVIVLSQNDIQSFLQKK